MVPPPENGRSFFKQKSSPVVVNNRLCRCLFGQADQLAVDKLKDEVLTADRIRFQQAWNFDTQNEPVVSVVDASSKVSSNGLVNFATRYQWKKMENEAIPYFYYKQQLPQAYQNSNVRPLDCKTESVKVPQTPRKRKRREMNKSSSTNLKCIKSSARRLDFSDVKIPTVIDNKTSQKQVKLSRAKLNFLDEFFPLSSKKVQYQTTLPMLLKTVKKTTVSSVEKNSKPNLECKRETPRKLKNHSKISKTPKKKSPKHVTQSRKNQQKLITDMLPTRRRLEFEGSTKKSAENLNIASKSYDDELQSNQ